MSLGLLGVVLSRVVVYCGFYGWCWLGGVARLRVFQKWALLVGCGNIDVKGKIMIVFGLAVLLVGIIGGSVGLAVHEARAHDRARAKAKAEGREYVLDKPVMS